MYDYTDRVRITLRAGEKSGISGLLDFEPIPFIQEVQNIISVRASFAFDGISSGLIFTCVDKITPFTDSSVEVCFIDDDKKEHFIFSGIIVSVRVEESGVFTVSCVTKGWLLTKSHVSPSRVETFWKDITPLAIINKVAEPFGITFYPSNDLHGGVGIGKGGDDESHDHLAMSSRRLQVAIKKYRIDSSATPADVILDVLKLSGLYTRHQIGALSPLVFDAFSVSRNNDYDINLNSESWYFHESPVLSANIEYDTENVYRERIALYMGDSRSLGDTYTFDDHFAPFNTTSILEVGQPDLMLQALTHRRAMNLMAACKLNFSIPNITAAGKLLQTGAILNVSASRFGIKEQTPFFITDILITADSNGYKADITACLHSAVFGSWI